MFSKSSLMEYILDDELLFVILSFELLLRGKRKIWTFAFFIKSFNIFIYVKKGYFLNIVSQESDFSLYQIY